MNSYNCRRCGAEVTWESRSHLCPCAMQHGEVSNVLTIYVPNMSKGKSYKKS